MYNKSMFMKPPNTSIQSQMTWNSVILAIRFIHISVIQKTLQDDDMIKIELLKIGENMAIQPKMTKKWDPKYSCLGFVTMRKKSPKKITSFAIQAFRIFNESNTSINLIGGVTCVALNDIETLERLIQIYQLIYMDGV